MKLGPLQSIAAGLLVEAMTYICDDMRHLVCLPYTIDNLHEMARQLGIKRCWYHAGSYSHYDVPKRRIDEITKKCLLVTPFDLLAVCKGEKTRVDQLTIK